MIPKKLELENFLSYRGTAVLDFQQIRLACISGPNGAGKSSILDGITWALFGRSRSRSDDDLVNRRAADQDEALEVRFTFELEGSEYRVIRRKKTGKSTILEFQMAAGNGRWKTLSEGRQRETQAAIEQTLRMNFDTFSNASFLLQGKADEFTTRTPNQRKEILAELLGVTEWETYRERAAAARKASENELLVFESRLAEISTELAEEPQRRADLQSAEAERAAIRERLSLKEQLLTEMRKTAAAIEQQELTVKNLRENLQRAEQKVQNAKNSLDNRQKEMDAYQLILANAEQISASYDRWQAAEGGVAAWQEKAQIFHQLDRQKQPFELEVAKMRSRLQQQQHELQNQARLADRAAAKLPTLTEEITGGQSNLAAIEAKIRELEDVQEKYNAALVNLQRREGERQLMMETLTQLENRESRMARLLAEKTAVSTNKAEAEKLLNQIDEQLASLNDQQAQHAALKGDLDNLKGRQKGLAEEMEVLRERIDQLATADTGSQCPTCGQDLTPEHRQKVIAEQKLEGKTRGDLYRANQAQIGELTAKVQNLEAAIKQRPKLERDRLAQGDRLAKAQARLDEIQEAEKEWRAEGQIRLAETREKLADKAALETERAAVNALKQALEPRKELVAQQRIMQQTLAAKKAEQQEQQRLLDKWAKEGKTQLAEVNQQLEREAFASEARETLQQLEEQIKAIGYDEVEHQAALAGREALADAPAQYQEWKQAEAAVVPLVKTLADLQASIEEQEQDFARQTVQFEAARSHLETLKAGQGDLFTLEDEVNQLREAEIAAAGYVGAAQQRLSVLKDQRKNLKTLETQKNDLSARIRRLSLLETACSRKGVQALLIERAVPEIEERANELLDRLTAGEMRIRFDTQRQLKSRDALAETLDITIADNNGTRPYGNYSGGEQFRVNFAIRLALSQLLAKRAGARLQTLVVDEGFGSQDPQGRQRLVEAINAVSDDFACILVITHIDELRDAFPTRIEVEKNRNGSQISVN